MVGRDSIRGGSLVAGDFSNQGTERFRGMNPRTGERGAEFSDATAEEVHRAAAAAKSAFEAMRDWGPDRIARLLRCCADALDAAGTELVSVADEETGLGRTRLEGELSRTSGQLRAFGKMVDAGWHLHAMIDTGGEGRPDVRRVLRPLGPVAVFGASNFPLAFSVPGGDTAAALAAGCPVVAKGHPSHPATSELSARLIASGVWDAGAPVGAFSMVQGSRPEVGESLVTADEIEAVAFTGSFDAGRAIHDLAAARERPIPVFAEMGSVNPVFITARALESRGEEMAEGLASSITLGTGQFCTKPGLIFVPEEGVSELTNLLTEKLGAVDEAPMLNPGILRAFQGQVHKSSRLEGVRLHVAPHSGGGPGVGSTAGLLSTSLDNLLRSPDLMEEHFGPVAILVSTPSDRLPEAARSLEGSLTATIHAEPSEVEGLGELHGLLQDRVGRVIWNGYPTGVAVVPSMNHGGPYPATTSPQHTSVGMTAVRRFMRPIAFQDAPPRALPPALQDENPLGLRRLVDWEWE